MLLITIFVLLFFTAAGAIICLGLSCTYHTVHCHSEFVGKLFSKLDYVGISFLILGSLVPWLYYSFYCQYQPKLIYLTVAFVLGTIAIIVSLWDQFSAPEYRSFRAGTVTIPLLRIGKLLSNFNSPTFL